jgi:hypothetical protein
MSRLLRLMGHSKIRPVVEKRVGEEERFIRRDRNNGRGYRIPPLLRWKKTRKALTVFMKLTSCSDVAYGPTDHSGLRNATGRFWTFFGPNPPHALDLFVATSRSRPLPKAGASFQVIRFPGKTGCTELGLIGHDRKNNRSYRILQSAEQE